MHTTIQTGLLLASVLLSGCRFFPEQRLTVEQPSVDRAEPRRGTTSAAVSSDGRSAEPSLPQAMRTASMTSPAADAGSGAAGTAGHGGHGGQRSSAQMDAGTQTEQESKRMDMKPASAGSSGMPPAAGSGGADSAEPTNAAQDVTCDFTGVWITKQVEVTVSLDEPEFLNAWGYYEIQQSGADFVVTKHIDCGGEGLSNSGGATSSRATLAALVQHNKQIGRKGHFALMNGKCVLDTDHFWSVRGAEETRFLPNPTRDSTMTMAEVKKIKPLPTPSMPDGAVDFEGDGQLGAATQISGIVSGVRNSCERDWDRWFTAPGYEVIPSMDFTNDLTLRVEFETDESVMSPTTGLLTTPAEVDNDWKHIMRFRFVGRTTDDPRAQAIVHADEVETCYAIQDAMPAEELKR